MTKITDIYWLAGFLDGEGYFGYQHGNIITISQTDLDLVERTKKIMKTNSSIKLTKAKKDNHQDKYTLTVSGTLAVQWMMTLYSIMSLRRKIRIRETLNYWKESKNRQKGADYCTKGHPLLKEKIDFWWQTNNHGGTTKVCVACKKEKQKGYYYRNLEESRKKAREYYHENLEEKREGQRRRHQENLEENRQKARAYYASRGGVAKLAKIIAINNKISREEAFIIAKNMLDKTNKDETVQ